VVLVQRLRIQCENEMAHRQQLRNAAQGWFFPGPDKMEVANSYDVFVPAAKLASDIVGGSNVPLKMGMRC
jgi:hypothetical protein